MNEPAPASLPRLLAGLEAGRALRLDEHIAVHGTAPLGREAFDIKRLIATLEQCALRGRGGGGFPVAAKLGAVARARRAPVVVVNGVEAEPVSEKDRTLLGQSPHLVLDGAQVAAAALSAGEVMICTPGSSEWVTAAVSAAVAERSGRLADVPMRVVPIPDAYVAGEETAVVSYLNDGTPLPTWRPPYVFERGVARRPTLVNNAETLAHIALIVRHGIDWFRQLGTTERPGSTLITLSGAVLAPGVYEAAYGTPIASLIENAGGQPAELRALLVGGCGGSFVPAGAITELTLDDESLHRAGAALGPGVIVAMPQSSCGVAETVALAEYLARASARQCGPCQFGLPAIAKSLRIITSGTADARERKRMEGWLQDVHGRGACRHPDAAIRVIRSALAVFSQEFAEHAHHGPCHACDQPGGPLTLGRHAYEAIAGRA